MSTGIHRSVRKIEPTTQSESTTTTEQFKNYLNTAYIILLGDPGSGKTFTFKEAANNPSSCFLSVRDFLALEGKGCAGKTLFLDGLDEYRSRGDDKNLVLEVIKLLNRINISRLRLSCRSADWLGESDLSPFRGYFDGKPYAVLNLEPLSGEEISCILEEKNIEPAGFIETATAHNLWNMLTNPQTLLMLIDVVGSGSWPATKLELYEKSVELLLSEHSSQQSQTKLGKYAPDELIAPAGALCASILLSGSAGISISNNQTDPSYPNRICNQSGALCASNLYFWKAAQTCLSSAW